MVGSGRDMLRVRVKHVTPLISKPFSGRVKAFNLTTPHIPPSPKVVWMLVFDFFYLFLLVRQHNLSRVLITMD